MRWNVYGERTMYESPWVNLALADVEIPGGRRFEHHVVHVPQPAVGCVVHDLDRGLLLLWRHRFITDSWGWEIPAGGADPGEPLATGAAREVLEETGWQPGPIEPLCRYYPSNGLSDQVFNCFVARGATHVGEPTDPGESERVEWVPVNRVRGFVEAGEVTDGMSLTALLYALAYDRVR
jgi:8-oxo-dGTP pyrophosphatase MutT (NUDIX family)